MIQYIIGHLRSKILTGKLICNQLEYPQLEVECEKTPLALTYERYKPLIICPKWVTALWEYLHTCQATIDFTPQWASNKSTIHEIIIMTALKYHTTGLSINDLRNINRYRLCLRVFFMSDIAIMIFIQPKGGNNDFAC
jgi:hypothetical protein